MTDTTVKLSGRILDDEIGVRSDDADELFHVEGKTRLALVDLESFRFTHDLDKNNVVTVRAVGLELLPAGDIEAFGRDLMAAVYRRRKPAPFDEGLRQPSADDVAARGRNAVVCQVCLHTLDDDRIKHEPDPTRDGAYCRWLETGEEVELDDDTAGGKDDDDA